MPVKGFTFTELLVSLLLFSLSVVGGLTVQWHVKQQVGASLEHLSASLLLTDLTQTLFLPLSQNIPIAGQFSHTGQGASLCQIGQTCSATEWVSTLLQQRLNQQTQKGVLGLPQTQLCIEQAVAGQIYLQLSWHSKFLTQHKGSGSCGYQSGRRMQAVRSQ